MAETPDLPAADTIAPEDNLLEARIIAVPTPTAEVVAAINARFALAPLKAEDIFTFRGTISTDAEDSYYTEMDKATTLPNFAEDFAAGQSLLDSHNSYMSSAVLGQSYAATLEQIAEAEGQRASARVVVDWYMPRDDGTAIPITRIVAGTLRRQSVGFGGNEMAIISKQDGKPLYESDYYPGQRLPDGTRATFLVVNARGMEGSLVFKNSTPGALVERGGRVGQVVARVADLARRGQIPRDEVARLGQRWGVRFTNAPQQYALGAPAAARQQQEGPMAGQGNTASIADMILVRKGAKLSAATRKEIEDTAGMSGEVRDRLMKLIESVVDDVKDGEKDNADRAVEDQRTAIVAAAIEIGLPLDRNAADVPAAFRAMEAELATLRQQAKDGEVYREHCITTALAEGVRAFGADKFDQAARRAALSKLPLDEIKERQASWAEIGDKRLPGGRATQEADAEPLVGDTGKRVAAPIVPLSAYRVG